MPNNRTPDDHIDKAETEYNEDMREMHELSEQEIANERDKET